MQEAPAGGLRGRRPGPPGRVGGRGRRGTGLTRRGSSGPDRRIVTGPTPSCPMPTDQAAAPTTTRVWQAVTDRLEAFARAWQAGPPELAGFVPPGPPAVRQLTLVELIKYDL